MAKDVTLTDKDNEQIYPRTFIKNVYDNDGVTSLDKILLNFVEDVDINNLEIAANSLSMCPTTTTTAVTNWKTGSYSAGTTTTLISSAPANGWFTSSFKYTGSGWFSCGSYSFRPVSVNGVCDMQCIIPVAKGQSLTFYANGAVTVNNVYVSSFIIAKEI